ncbi:MAG: FHA domain-containing protein [Myxococcota bacterium]|nr:FHA domain-containing protein [Myxococcota bacterium]
MSPQASLVYTSEDGAKQDLILDDDEESTVGRHPGCTLTVSQPSVSRKHARFWFEGGNWYVADLQSSNGTYVNNRRIEQEKLREGDEVRCGDFAMTYIVEERTREVGTKPPQLPKKKKMPAKPRYVGQLDDSADVSSRATVGVADPGQFELDAKSNTEPPVRTSDEDADAKINHDEERAKALEHELSHARTKLDALTIENTRLKEEQTEFGKMATAKTALEAELKAAETEIVNLMNRAQAAESALETVRDEMASSSAASHEDLHDALTAVYEDLDSFTSDLRLKLKLSAALLDELAPMIETIEEVGAMKLSTQVAERLKPLIDDANALETMAAVQSTFAGADLAARRTRRLMRLFGTIMNEKPGQN